VIAGGITFEHGTGGRPGRRFCFSCQETELKLEAPYTIETGRETSMVRERLTHFHRLIQTYTAVQRHGYTAYRSCGSRHEQPAERS
jgi:hypothetical protein